MPAPTHPPTPSHQATHTPTHPHNPAQGEALHTVEEPSEGDGEPTLVWVLSGRPGLAAGGKMQGLALRCLDEVGRPSRPIRGRLQVWRHGARGAWCVVGCLVSG